MLDCWFVDFSSAFNTIQPHLLINKLVDIKVRPKMFLWLLSFLCDRRQYVNLNGVHSSMRTTNTGSPQGYVLSPLLFSLYTNDCRKLTKDCLLKYADDTVIIGLLQNDNCCYFNEVSNFTIWSKIIFLNSILRKPRNW
jgi:hypothetical protein